MIRRSTLTLLAAMLAAGLAACGRAGPPQVPAGRQDTLQNRYPPPEDGDRYPPPSEIQPFPKRE
ncbi:MAG TPA: hypothetical protein VKY65_11795 [Alphaproteobacteria bacterium]|nr:hypothetical protein [Alphaproteobacteria bacterium]